ncbi:MAG: methylated-DNA--[protein]-cysteine S-methyltransferase [Caldilineaceae bacterium SB0670_bin_27]|uniref:Methylated-DNA--protein-cysteine methyltransferase n=1 Tax=Caldilineaceae bacterium SB0664_bin_27 TaxID=2605260 RepID=A0A6B0YQF0_9CHLR|nr:methylated-DNA--[protein]-cysteine S-methyltransferase [Caldilineaceae bacterium SB0664_bin_27]MYF28997.1 methylated-DNA--[protein]-cysteine S-methyltransferase [Gammaproteobacteria bacterium]MYJ79256.1 methylated-DNA--[protein]-cysteine S-methyltransferase [Caldilineaceae bacterium SB0670_bin_27]
MSLVVTSYDSPIGSIEIYATDTAVGSVKFVGEQIGESEEEKGEQSWVRDSSSLQAGANPLLEEVRRQLDAYFAGDLRSFDLPLELDGTPFQRQVWQQLLSVDYGQTASYQDIAVAIDNPKAVRAVGAANGRNPVSIIVPCHRIVGSGGRAKLTGYGGGLWRKEWLLRHEGVLLV